jgi:hypothetical protein
LGPLCHSSCLYLSPRDGRSDKGIRWFSFELEKLTPCTLGWQMSKSWLSCNVSLLGSSLAFPCPSCSGQVVTSQASLILQASWAVPQTLSPEIFLSLRWVSFMVYMKVWPLSPAYRHTNVLFLQNSTRAGPSQSNNFLVFGFFSFLLINLFIHLTIWVLGFEPQAMCMLSRHCTTESHSSLKM